MTSKFALDYQTVNTKLPYVDQKVIYENDLIVNPCILFINSSLNTWKHNPLVIHL